MWATALWWCHVAESSHFARNSSSAWMHLHTCRILLFSCSSHTANVHRSNRQLEKKRHLLDTCSSPVEQQQIVADIHVTSLCCRPLYWTARHVWGLSALPIILQMTYVQGFTNWWTKRHNRMLSTRKCFTCMQLCSMIVCTEWKGWGTQGRLMHRERKSRASPHQSGHTGKTE